MNIFASLATMNASVDLRGESSPALIAAVGALLPPLPVHGHKALRVARGLDAPPISMRPIDAMMRLARLTAPTVPSNVYQLYKHWAWLRYLGVFERVMPNRLLRLSGSGAAVAANQRRVMSEELGVGFGALLAERWCRALGFSGTISFCDVEQVLLGSYPGIPPVVASGKRPDYLIQVQPSPSPSGSRGVSYLLLECKGTRTAHHAKRQLASALTQISALRLSGKPVPGVAISTISADSEVSYVAIDPEDPVPVLRPEEFNLERARTPKSVDRRGSRVLHLDRRDFLMAASAVSLGHLADYAGQHQTAATWLPEPLVKRLNRKPAQSAVRETVHGEFVGRELEFPAPGASGVLRVFQGVERGIAAALESNELEVVIDAQSRFADIGGSFDNQMDENRSEATPDRFASSVSSEGACLSLEVID